MGAAGGTPYGSNLTAPAVAPPARLAATTTVHGCLLSACPVVNSTQRVVGSKENTSRGNSTKSAFFSQLDYFRIARDPGRNNSRQVGETCD
jgi:hypothetical protein